MRVGITGTQRGTDLTQYTELERHLRDLRPDFLHHGDCVGADTEAHFVAGLMRIPVILHPPINPTKRAFCQGALETRDPKEYLVRNKDIVDETDMLIALPFGREEVQRSGTWATVRYARSLGRRIIMLYPRVRR